VLSQTEIHRSSIAPYFSW